MRSPRNPPGAASEGIAIQFANSWKNARKEFRRSYRATWRRPSGKNIHAMRIGTRRLMAHLEVLAAGTVAPERKLESARRRLKRVMSATSPVRDARVQRKLQANLFPSDPDIGLGKFHRHLKKREQRLKRRLQRRLDSWPSGWFKFHYDNRSSDFREALTQDAACAAAEQRALQRARTRIEERLSAPSMDNPVAHHRLRVALKKFRYLVEACPPQSIAADEALERWRTGLAVMGELHDYDEWLHQIEKFSLRHRTTADWLRRRRKELQAHRRALWLQQPRISFRAGRLQVTARRRD